MKTLDIRHIFHLAKDYIYILVGLAIYATGFSCFMLPYEITSGGVSGIAALIYYSTGFNAAY
ncbi:MAG: YitT family protein, partial [Bacteroidaceae bacterium]|nr:YitT family protein [Bacteroidaceae bacterium]